MHRLILALVLLLGACAGAPERPAMSSVVGFEPTRFSGNWYEVAAIGRAPGGRWQVTAGKTLPMRAI